MARAEADIGTDLEYAGIQEFGGTITPKTALMLRWVDDQGVAHFAKSATIPARPYLRPAFDEDQDRAVDAVASVLRQVVARHAR